MDPNQNSTIRIVQAFVLMGKLCDTTAAALRSAAAKVRAGEQDAEAADAMEASAGDLEASGKLLPNITASVAKTLAGGPVDNASKTLVDMMLVIVQSSQEALGKAIGVEESNIDPLKMYRLNESKITELTALIEQAREEGDWA